MTERIVKKSLAGRQDILFGKGQVTQSRAGGSYPINKVAVAWACADFDELFSLDVTQFTEATVNYLGSVTHWGWTGTNWYCRETDLTLVGSFSLGFTLTGPNQVGCSGENIFSWPGPYPKVVTAGSPTAGFVPRRSIISAAVSPFAYGAAVGVDSTEAIKHAIAECISTGKALDLRGGPLLFSAQLDFTGVTTVLCDYRSELVCDPTGFTAPTVLGKKFAITLGLDNGSPHTGRCAGISVIGSLVVRSSSRVTTLDGVFIKGSFINAGHIRAVNFNGHGVYRDSVWDSTFQRISVELCGNTTKHAYWHSSTGDTSNASHTVSLQVEQAYHKGFYIDAIRDVISNIHAERLYQLTSNDGSSNIDGSTWLNSHITLTNSCLVQMICDSATVNPPTGESIVSGQTYRVIVNGVNLTASSVVVAGSVLNSYGHEITLNGLNCLDFISNAPASNITLIEPNIVTLSAANKITVNGGSVYNMRAQFNASGHSYNNVTIDNINFTNNVLGDIDFKSCDIRLVTDTKIASSASKAPVEFYGCTIQEYQGAYNSRANIHGGYVHLFSLVSQGLPHCFNVKFGTFSPTGDHVYLTRGCTANSISGWTYPTNVNYPAGTITERVGYDVAGKLYQNTDGALNWVKLV